MRLLSRRARCRLPECQSRSYDAGPGQMGSIHGDNILYHSSLEDMAFSQLYRSCMSFLSPFPNPE